MKQIIIINCSRLHDDEAVQLAGYHVASERCGADRGLAEHQAAAYGVTVTKSKPMMGPRFGREVTYMIRNAEGGAGDA